MCNTSPRSPLVAAHFPRHIARFRDSFRCSIRLARCMTHLWVHSSSSWVRIGDPHPRSPRRPCSRRGTLGTAASENSTLFRSRTERSSHCWLGIERRMCRPRDNPKRGRPDCRNNIHFRRSTFHRRRTEHSRRGVDPRRDTHRTGSISRPWSRKPVPTDSKRSRIQSSTEDGRARSRSSPSPWGSKNLRKYAGTNRYSPNRRRRTLGSKNHSGRSGPSHSTCLHRRFPASSRRRFGQCRHSLADTTGRPSNLRR